MFPWGLAWGQGDAEQRVKVPLQAFVLLPLLSSLCCMVYEDIHRLRNERRKVDGQVSAFIFIQCLSALQLRELSSTSHGPSSPPSPAAAVLISVFLCA